MFFKLKNSQYSVVLESIFAFFLQKPLFSNSFDSEKPRKLPFSKENFGVIKHIKTCFIQKSLFLDFFTKHFLENIKNRLFVSEEFDYW